MRDPSVAGNTLAQSPYPLRVAYDGYAFTCSDGGAGKGAQLRNLLDGFGSTFTGFGPLTRNNRSARYQDKAEALRLIHRGRFGYLVWQQACLPGLLAKMMPDVFLAPYNTAPLRIPSSIKLISVIHDLILFENLPGRTLRQRLKDKYRAMLVHNAIERSSLILTVSNFTANRIRNRFPQVKPRVIHCTVGPSWFVRGNAVPLARREPYILMVTSFAAHKNFPKAMEAFARFRARDSRSKIRLRMVGVSYGSKVVGAIMKRLGLPDDAVIIEPFLSENQLQHLYQHALCAIIPSLMEGFGIPALEAMASGTPLLSSNTWSLPEVGADAPLYFDPNSMEEMSQGISRVCTSPDLRLRLMEQGLARAEVFHPDRIQHQVRDFWRELPKLYNSWTA